MIKKILVPTDGSEPANRALDLAIDLATKYSAEIVLLSVAPSVIVPMPEPGAMTPISPELTKYSETLKESHKKMLSQALEKAKKTQSDLKVSKKLGEGRPSEEIIEVAKEGNFDIIVMGSRGLGGIKKVFLGSVSHRVATEAPCPVLMVK